MQSPKDQVKDRLSIVEVISSYITVIEAGKNYKAKCPFHNEKTPSFFISPDRGTYYCFGCGEKGDIFSFVEKFEGTDFMGALKLLAGRAGVELVYDKRNIDSKDDKERWYEIMEEATKFYERNFIDNKEARAYLLGRGMTNITIESFRIGYSPDQWRSVSDYLIKKGYKKSDLEIVGLIKIKDGNDGENNFYDRFRSRIMFPISDSSGRVIAFSGRIFNKPDSEEGKYINSPDSPLFNKSNVLFGIDKAKSAIRTRGYSIIVEGQMDLIMSHQALFTNTVAVSGTALSNSLTEDKDNLSKINNFGLIRRLSPNIIFAYDGDEAGIRAVSRSAVIALSLDMQVKVAVLPEGKDPADIIMEDPLNWKDIIKNSVNIISFHIDRICKSNNDIRARGRKIKEIVFPFLYIINSAIERDAYINEIHNKVGISTEAIIEDLKFYEKNQKPKVNNKIISNSNNKEDQKSRREHLERKLFGIIFWSESKKDDLAILSEFKDRIGEDEFNKIRELHEPFRDTLAFEAEMWYNDNKGLITEDILEILLNLEEEVLNEKKLVLLDKISLVENTDNMEILQPVLLEYQKTLERIEYIKNKRSQ